MRSSRWLAVTATFSLIAACGGDDDTEADEDAASPTTTVAVTVTTAAVPATDSQTTSPSSAPAAAEESAAFVADAPPLASRFTPVDPGTYRVDTLGTPLTFTIDEPMSVQLNGRGFFVLTDPASLGPDDRDLVFIRLSALSDPTAPTTPPDEMGEGWPAGDIDGWIENLSDAIAVTNRAETTLGGLPATSFDMVLGDHGCEIGTFFCAMFGTNHERHAKDLSPGSQYRVWVVDQGDEDPLALIVGINRDDDVGFFDTADAVLSTLAFGEVGPNPVFEAQAGPIEVPFLGGIRIELADAAIVMQGPPAIAPSQVPGDTEFLFNPTTPDGGAIESVDALIEVFAERNVVVTEIEATTIDGVEARVFDIGASRGPALLHRSPGPGEEWFPPQRGRMWLIEHPERGLLMITAEAFDNVDEVFPVILAQTEPIIESMEFIDLG